MGCLQQSRSTFMCKVPNQCQGGQKNSRSPGLSGVTSEVLPVSMKYTESNPAPLDMWQIGQAVDLILDLWLLKMSPWDTINCRASVVPEFLRDILNGPAKIVPSWPHHVSFIVTRQFPRPLSFIYERGDRICSTFLTSIGISGGCTRTRWEYLSL